jgi:hypothetical protein
LLDDCPQMLCMLLQPRSGWRCRPYRCCMPDKKLLAAIQHTVLGRGVPRPVAPNAMLTRFHINAAGCVMVAGCLAAPVRSFV